MKAGNVNMHKFNIASRSWQFDTWALDAPFPHTWQGTPVGNKLSKYSKFLLKNNTWHLALTHGSPLQALPLEPWSDTLEPSPNLALGALASLSILLGPFVPV